MKIHGLQKMTLLDFPGHVACTVFLGGCDWRCPFCHNYELASGAAPAVMTQEELFAFLEKRKGILDGVAFTGGEPLLRPSLPDVLAKVREMGFAVKLDTNGAHPEALGRILEERLADYVAMDIKNSPEKYALTCGVEKVDLDAVTKSIHLLMDSGTDYEFRTTVVAELHGEDDFHRIGSWIRGARHMYLQCFTDRDTVPYGNLTAPSKQQLETYRSILENYVENVQIRGVE